MKEQIIQLPDNFEVKEVKDGKIILIEKEKKLTYARVLEELFENKRPHFIDNNCVIVRSDICRGNQVYYSNNCTSEKQAKKLLAINKLMNVAKYLNDGWQPDWNSWRSKYYIYIDRDINIDFATERERGDIYFKSRELAEQAIEILGEETIKLALCTDY